MIKYVVRISITQTTTTKTQFMNVFFSGVQGAERESSACSGDHTQMQWFEF